MEENSTVVEQVVSFAAVEDGFLAPAVMEEVMANVRPEDTKSQILKKVRIGTEVVFDTSGTS